MPRPFDPRDDFDAMANSFRVKITEMFQAAPADPRFAELSSLRQLECFLCGVLTGAIGVGFAHVTPQGRDDVMRMLELYLPQARLNVEDMLREELN